MGGRASLVWAACIGSAGRRPDWVRPAGLAWRPHGSPRSGGRGKHEGRGWESVAPGEGLDAAAADVVAREVQFRQPRVPPQRRRQCRRPRRSDVVAHQRHRPHPTAATSAAAAAAAAADSGGGEGRGEDRGAAVAESVAKAVEHLP